MWVFLCVDVNFPCFKSHLYYFLYNLYIYFVFPHITDDDSSTELTHPIYQACPHSSQIVFTGKLWTSQMS